MAKVRVWNITDDARTDVEAHTRMVLGKVIKPGRSVLVDAERLENATKVHREVKSGLLHVGEQLPEGYMTQKKPPRATVDARIVNDRGIRTGEKVAVSTGHGQAVESSEKNEEPKTEDRPETSEETGRGRRHRRY